MRDMRSTYEQSITIGYVALACCLIHDKDGRYREACGVLHHIDHLLGHDYRYGKHKPFSFYVSKVLDVYQPGMSRREASRRSGVSKDYVGKIYREIILKKAPADATARAQNKTTNCIIPQGGVQEQ